MVYVGNVIDDMVAVIDGRIEAKVADVKVDEAPTSIFVNPITNVVYTTNYIASTISIITQTTLNGNGNMTSTTP